MADASEMIPLAKVPHHPGSAEGANKPRHDHVDRLTKTSEWEACVHRRTESHQQAHQKPTRT
eukprot:12671943-Alexandrium_andersonii.AAC.1